MWPLYQINLVSTGWDINLICGYSAGSIHLKRGRLWLICNNAIFIWRSPAIRCGRSAGRIQPICAKFPRTRQNRNLTFNRPCNILSSRHTSHFGDHVPAVSFLFWSLLHIPLHWAELDLFAMTCWLEWVYYPMASRAPADCMIFLFLTSSFVNSRQCNVQRSQGCSSFWCRDHNVWHQWHHVQSHFSSL